MAVPEEIPEVLVRPPDAPPLPPADPGGAAAAAAAGVDAGVDAVDWSTFGAPAEMKSKAAGAAGRGADPWAEFGAPNPSGALSDIVKSGAAGLAKGTAGLVGMPGDIAEASQHGVDYLLPPPKGIPRVPVAENMKLPRSSEVRKQIEGWTGPLHKPETPLGGLAEDVGELIPGVIATGGGAPGAVARISRTTGDIVKGAAIPAAAGEAAQAVAPDDLKPYAKLGGALVAGLAASKVARPGTAQRALKEQLPDYVTEMHINDAGSLIDDARRAGMRLTWPEALSQVTGRPVLLDTQRLLEGSRKSAPVMEDALAGRGQAADRMVRSQSNTIHAPPHDPDVIGPQTGRAADEALEDVRRIINQHAEPFYAASRTTQLTPQEYRQALAIPGVREAIAAIRADTYLAPFVQGIRDDTVGMMNEVKKFIGNQAHNERNPITQNTSAQRASRMERSEGDVRQAAINAEQRVTPAGQANAYETALATEEAARAALLEPLNQGPLGKLANKDITTKNAIKAMFPKDPLSWSEDKVRQTMEALVQRNEPAARALVRAHVEYELDKAINSMGRTGESAAFAGAKFAHNIAGSPVINTQRLGNLRVSIEALPGGDQIWRGFDRMLEILQATGQRQTIGSKTSFNTQAMKDLQTGSSIGNLGKNLSAPAKWLSKMGDVWAEWQMGRNLNEMARIITDPRARPIFERLASLPPNSSENPRLVARLIAIGQGSRSATEGAKQ